MSQERPSIKINPSLQPVLNSTCLKAVEGRLGLKSEALEAQSLQLLTIKRLCPIQNLPELSHFGVAHHLIASADPLALTNRARGGLATTG